MYLLHRIEPIKINANYNTREEILRSSGPLSFDGIYTSVFANRDILIDRDVTLFVMGEYVGGNNMFDLGQPYADYCTWDQIIGLVSRCGMKLGWHSWTHRDLRDLSDGEIKREVTPPFPMKSFAYPYGKFNDRVLAAVENAGYEEAYGVFDGDNSRFQKLRKYL